jgi:hypothetical protein
MNLLANNHNARRATALSEKRRNHHFTIALGSMAAQHARGRLRPAYLQ